jgi:hypothetical protein
MGSEARKFGDVVGSQVHAGEVVDGPQPEQHHLVVEGLRSNLISTSACVTFLNLRMGR